MNIDRSPTFASVKSNNRTYVCFFVLRSDVGCFTGGRERSANVIGQMDVIFKSIPTDHSLTDEGIFLSARKYCNCDIDGELLLGKLYG